MIKYLCLFTFHKFTKLNLKKYLSSRHRNQRYNFSNISNCLTFSNYISVWKTNNQTKKHKIGKKRNEKATYNQKRIQSCFLNVTI